MAHLSSSRRGDALLWLREGEKGLPEGTPADGQRAGKSCKTHGLHVQASRNEVPTGARGDPRDQQIMDGGESRLAP